MGESEAHVCTFAFYNYSKGNIFFFVKTKNSPHTFSLLTLIITPQNPLSAYFGHLKYKFLLIQKAHFSQKNKFTFKIYIYNVYISRLRVETNIFTFLKYDFCIYLSLIKIQLKKKTSTINTKILASVSAIMGMIYTFG